MDQMVNQSISRYKLVALLGEGGMGAVFKAFDVTLQRDVAIKVMHSHFARQPNFQERFLQEARTAARLNHPGIVQVYDFGQERGQLFIVMKLIAGKNLEKVLENLQAKNEVLPLLESLNLLVQVSQGLDYAHKAGVLHRDLKPANIMVEPDATNPQAYRPVLTDLGLAKLAEGGMVTMDGTSMGTPAYMSPEQALGQKTDPRSDVYSLGVLLFELVTGRRPFPAGSLTEAIRYHTKEIPPKPSSLRPDLPAGLEQIILQALEKDPSQRFASANELAAALQAVSKAVQAAGTTGNRPSTATVMTESPAPAASLATQFSDQPPDGRGASMFENVQGLNSARQDRVQLITKDGASQMIEIGKPALTLGRGEDNDVVLADSQASRHHARIEFSDGKARVYDLNSTNGTFLAGARLLPGIAEDWSPDKPLRIGDTALRWVRGEQGLPDTDTQVHRREMPIPMQGTAAQPAGPAQEGEARIALQVNNPALTLTPGQPSSLTLTLFNQGTVVDHFRIVIEGVPAKWLPSQHAPIQLMPGARQTITFAIQPPRAPESRAGRYPLVVRAASRDNPNQMAEVRLTVTVAPYTQFSAELFPQRLIAGRLGRLTVHNNGNTQETFNLSFIDRADELAFEPPSQQVRVEEGQAVSAEFRARPRQRRLLGGAQQHPFTARIQLPQGEAQTQNGELVSRAVIPPWVLPLLAVIIMLALAGGGMAYNAVQTQARQATATADGVNTAIAAVVAETAKAVNAETVMAEANLMTEQAATQNAILKGTADFSSTQLAALQQTGTQAVLDAQNSQNAQTSTALAGQVLTLQANQDNQAATATMAVQLTSQAATTQAAVITTPVVDNSKELDFFTGTWTNPSPVNNQLTRLIIEKVDDNTVSFHAFNECNPDDCDIGTNNEVAFTLPTTEGSVGVSGRNNLLTIRRTIKVTSAANRQDLDVTVEVYSLLTRTTTTYYYTFKRELFIRPILIP